MDELVPFYKIKNLENRAQVVGNLVKLVNFTLPALPTYLQCELLKPSKIKNIVCETYKIDCYDFIKLKILKIRQNLR